LKRSYSIFREVQVLHMKVVHFWLIKNLLNSQQKKWLKKTMY